MRVRRFLNFTSQLKPFLRDAEEHHVDPFSAFPFVTVELFLKIFIPAVPLAKGHVVAIYDGLAPRVGHVLGNPRAQLVLGQKFFKFPAVQIVEGLFERPDWLPQMFRGIDSRLEENSALCVAEWEYDKMKKTTEENGGSYDES